MVFNRFTTALIKDDSENIHPKKGKWLGRRKYKVFYFDPGFSAIEASRGLSGTLRKVFELFAPASEASRAFGEDYSRVTSMFHCLRFMAEILDGKPLTAFQFTNM